MIRLADEPSENSNNGRADGDGRSSKRTAYGRVFWLCYLSNASTMIALSMLVRYADFVEYLGGSDAQLGLIVGVGMTGGLLMRVAQGIGIDRFGARHVWLFSLLLLIATLAAHLLVTTAHGPFVFLLRVLMSTAVAGIFGASVTYISRQVPPQRMAEIIGTLGTSGFFGIFIGPHIGDWIFFDGAGEEQICELFLFSGALVCIALLAALAATNGEPRPKFRRQPSAWLLLRRYNPGVVLLVAAAVGAGINVPSTFLPPFTQGLDIPTVGLFFSVYAVTAFVVRVSTARLPQKLGTRPMIIMGLSALSTSMLLYLLVGQTWHLVLPALAAGTAHAFLFPSVVASASTRFPERYRGLGTTLVMGCFDVGVLIGAPAMGGVLRLAQATGLPPYPTMFAFVAAALGTIQAAYFFASRRAARDLKRATHRKQNATRIDEVTNVEFEPAEQAAPAAETAHSCSDR